MLCFLYAILPNIRQKKLRPKTFINYFRNFCKLAFFIHCCFKRKINTKIHQNQNCPHELWFYGTVRSKRFGPISHEAKPNVILGRSHEPKYHPYHTRPSQMWYQSDILASVTCFHDSKYHSYHTRRSRVWYEPSKKEAISSLALLNESL